MGVQFSAGEVYTATDWFTGGQMFYQVKSTTGKTVVFKVADWEPDGVSHREETYEVFHDTDGEYVVYCEYNGHEGRIYAGNSIGGPDEEEED